ncbi:XRE family transcriptional regulator [Lactococcus lactis]|uniref:XRE family transcriptional regulator n=1 Tax=Lactococcus lactis TaxID=1358 RepID=UPI0004E11BB6|nr:XRE family transcriptional regulator [Lactococcus lactis]OJH47546.1 XRE family transcriptional regulator [Lactococcus lactis subsp. lactis bv. diacetylactis]
MDLYEKIKELASQKNVSIRQVEEKLGFANGTIRQWGRKNPGVNKVKDVAKYFNVSVDYLLGLDEDESTTQTVDLAELANKPKDFDWDSVLSVGGKPIPEEDKEIIRRLFAHKLSD